MNMNERSHFNFMVFQISTDMVIPHSVFQSKSRKKIRFAHKLRAKRAHMRARTRTRENFKNAPNRLKRMQKKFEVILSIFKF